MTTNPIPIKQRRKGLGKKDHCWQVKTIGGGTSWRYARLNKNVTSSYLSFKDMVVCES